MSANEPPLVLVTGFGPFLDVQENPSGALAEALEAAPPEGIRIRHRVLPVTFEGVPRALAEFLAAPEHVRPTLLLGLGVHRGASFRFEQNARAEPTSDKPDTSGTIGLGMSAGKPRATSVDVFALARELSDRSQELGFELQLSSDAGGYVCDWTYQHLLRLGEHLRVPALFLHVPSAEAHPVDQQLPFVREVVERLVSR